MCAKIAHMDISSLGRRLAQAREDAEMTQAGLGRAVDLDRTAINRLENGERKLNVPELVRIAGVLRRPLSYFVSEPAPAVISRRNAGSLAHDTTRRLDSELDHFAADISTLLNRDILSAPERLTFPLPSDHESAERVALAARSHAGLGDGPIPDLSSAVEALGMYLFVTSLGDGVADGGCVEVDTEEGAVAAAVVNGDTPPGRRRMTLAHELGHWMFGDAYDTGASQGAERMINSFAIHFLAPRSGVSAMWSLNRAAPVYDRALTVAARFQLSWSAAVGQLKNLHLIDDNEYRVLSHDEPRLGDFLRLGVSWRREMDPPFLSQGLVSAILDAYVDGRLTDARSIELLRGSLNMDELPERSASGLKELRRSFLEHDD